MLVEIIVFCPWTRWDLHPLPCLPKTRSYCIDDRPKSPGNVIVIKRRLKLSKMKTATEVVVFMVNKDLRPVVDRPLSSYLLYRYRLRCQILFNNLLTKLPRYKVPGVSFIWFAREK